MGDETSNEDNCPYCGSPPEFQRNNNEGGMDLCPKCGAELPRAVNEPPPHSDKPDDDVSF